MKSTAKAKAKTTAGAAEQRPYDLDRNCDDKFCRPEGRRYESDRQPQRQTPIPRAIVKS